MTFFTTAPLEVLQAAMAGAEAERAEALAAERGTAVPVPEAAVVPAAPAAGVMEAKVAAAQAAQAAAVAAAAVEGLQLGDAEQVCALPRGVAKSEAELEIESGEAADGELTLLGEETLSWLQGAPPLRLRTTEQVHFDPLNIPLLGALPGAVRAGDAVLYPGCGSGLLGLLALRTGAASVHFTDSLASAVDLTAANARVAGFREGRNWTAQVSGASVSFARIHYLLLLLTTYYSLLTTHYSLLTTHCLLTQVSDLRAAFTDAPQYDLLLCNPPQLAGPPALGVARPDRYAGPEGVDYYAELARLANTALKPTGRVALMQTSLSSFAAVRSSSSSSSSSSNSSSSSSSSSSISSSSSSPCHLPLPLPCAASSQVDALFAPRQPTTLASQPRTAAAASLEAQAPGALSWLLALRARGASDFELRDAAGAVLPPAAQANGGGGAVAEPTVAECEATLHFSQRLVVFG